MSSPPEADSQAGLRSPATAGGPARGRLLMIRKAGAAFAEPFLLRPRRFEEMLEERGSLQGAIEGAREALVEALFEAVPRQSGRRARREVLNLKRRVFNRRPAAEPSALVAIDDALRAELGGYFSRVERLRALYESGREEVFAEHRERIRELLDDPAFRLACRYSSTDLSEAIGKREENDAGDGFTPLDRGIYAYASRFLGKANPFYLFAQVIFPPGGIEASGFEIVLDTELIFALEEEILPAVDVPERLWICPRPWLRHGDKYRFWAPSPRGLRLLTLRHNRLLELVLEFFAERCRRDGRPTATRADCERHLAGLLAPDQLELARHGLDQLIRQGVLAAYLVTDFGSPATAMSGFLEPLDEPLETLERHHLAQLSTVAEVERADAELAAVAGRLPEGSPVGYYVNSYLETDTAAAEAAAAELGPELADVAPCFAAEHNFSERADSLRSFVLDYLRRRGAATVPYSEILLHFLQHQQEVIDRYRPEVRLSAEERQRVGAWRDRLAGAGGVLDRRQLDDLAPPWEPEPRTEAGLCFNGPYDAVERVYYITNVFAGGGRFATRYALRRGSTAGGDDPGGEGELDVELAVPPQPNLNYVVGRYRTGCGFEARYAHRYRRWLDPSEIAIGDADGRVVYLHEPSARRIRFHYGGFLLAQLLPTEYQLLLVGHADTFSNPFKGRLTAPPEQEIWHRPGLTYGALSLRRESWILGRSVLARVRDERDELRAAAELGDWFRDRLESDEELWFYHAIGLGNRGSKPRLLDLRSPLSVFSLRRVLAALPKDGAVSLSPMRPGPTHLARFDGAPCVTELMIEI